MFPNRYFLLALAACSALTLANRGGRRIVPAIPDVAVATQGSFKPGGGYPCQPFADTVGVRARGSWSGSDDNDGPITIGPFPAPRTLRFGTSGYLANPLFGSARHRMDRGVRAERVFRAEHGVHLAEARRGGVRLRRVRPGGRRPCLPR